MAKLLRWNPRVIEKEPRSDNQVNLVWNDEVISPGTSTVRIGNFGLLENVSLNGLPASLKGIAVGDRVRATFQLSLSETIPIRGAVSKFMPQVVSAHTCRMIAVVTLDEPLTCNDVHFQTVLVDLDHLQVEKG